MGISVEDMVKSIIVNPHKCTPPGEGMHSVKKMGLCVLLESKKKEVYLTMNLSQL